MKKNILIMIALFLFQGVCLSQMLQRTENIVQFFKNLKGLSGFDNNNYIVNSAGEVFFAYDAPEPADVPSFFTHTSMFLAKLDRNGDIVFDRLKIFDEYDFAEGYEKCYTDDSFVIVLAGRQHSTAIIGIYDIDKDVIDVISRDDIVFVDVSGAFDDQGDFHITVRYGRRYIKLEKDNNYQISIEKIIPENKYIFPIKIISDYEQYSPTMSCKSFIWNNKMVTIYYMNTFVKGGHETRKGRDDSINYYDKIGLQVLDLKSYSYDEFRVYDIEEIASEKIEDINYLKIKVYQSDSNKIPEIFIGGKEGGKNNLYRIKFDNNLLPKKPVTKKVKTYIKDKTFPKEIKYDFYVEPKLYKGKYIAFIKKYNFIGIETGESEDNYYYLKKE